MILQDTAKGEHDHGTKLPSDTAMTLALRGWIAVGQTVGRVLRYRITSAGRVALPELMEEGENHARALAEDPASFEGAPTGVGVWDNTQIMARVPNKKAPLLHCRAASTKTESHFLSRSMVRAAERLREDYELAQIGRPHDGKRPTDWEAVLRAIQNHQPIDTTDNVAAVQVGQALGFLGPGLSEIALRCCCLLEGLETTEKYMGWAARWGKVVLRIALQRLVLHYEATG